MASQPGAAAQPIATASIVGNAFVSQYYNVLHQSPHVVHRFYTDQSKLSRAEAGPNGAVDTVVTQAGIYQKVMSMDYGDIRAEIKTVDSQESLNGSVLVMVTGSLSSQSQAKRNFVQTFFLAPQEKGYFVLNDMFRYLDGEAQPPLSITPLANGNPEPTLVSDVPDSGNAEPQIGVQQEEREFPNSSVEEATSYEDNYGHQDEEEEAAEPEEVPAEEATTPQLEAAPTTTEEQVPPPDEETNTEEAPKKSYASILRKTGSGSSVPSSIAAPPKASPVQADRGLSSSQVPRPAPPPTATQDIDQNGPPDLEGDGLSVYVKNLPLSITSAELQKEFEKFGPIKPGGLNLRNQRQGVCFAFIEFEDSSSAQSAIEASPFPINGRQVFVEEKRPMPAALRAGRGRFNQGRGFQIDGMRGGRGYYGGRGSGRGEDFNRGRGSGTGRGTYGAGNAYASNSYVNGYRRADNQGGTTRPMRRGAGNQMGRGRGSGAE